MSDTPDAAATAACPTAFASMHAAAPQVLAFPAHCGPLLPRKVPVYEQEGPGWGDGGGGEGRFLKKRRKKSKAYLVKKKQKKKVPVFPQRMKYLLKKHNATSSFVLGSLHQSTLK